VTCFGSCTASNPPLRGSIDPFAEAAELGDAPLSFDMTPDLQPLTISSNTVTAAVADTAVALKRRPLLAIRLMPDTVADPRPYVSPHSVI
jgi:hypothetical protein